MLGERVCVGLRSELFTGPQRSSAARRLAVAQTASE